MIVKLKPTVYRIKNGYAAENPIFGLAAHGETEVIAKQNFQILMLDFFRSLERQKNVDEILKNIANKGISISRNGTELSIILEN